MVVRGRRRRCCWCCWWLGMRSGGWPCLSACLGAWLAGTTVCAPLGGCRPRRMSTPRTRAVTAACVRWHAAMVAALACTAVGSGRGASGGSALWAAVAATMVAGSGAGLVAGRRVGHRTTCTTTTLRLACTTPIATHTIACGRLITRFGGYQPCRLAQLHQLVGPLHVCSSVASGGMGGCCARLLQQRAPELRHGTHPC